jgi:hypothetical protein
MAKYLIPFPSAAMIVPDGEWEAVGRDAHAVIDEAKAAGVYVTVSILIRCRRLLCLIRNARDFDHGRSCQNLAQLAHPIASCLGRTKPTAAKVIKLIEMVEFDFVVQ